MSGTDGPGPASGPAPGPASWPDDRRERHAATFGRAADRYARSRPGYPDAAVDWLVADARTVCDLGAGTGKLTRALVDRGLAVRAVDPSPEMLDQLRAAVPEAEAVVGRAEATGLPDAAVDLVVAAQSWHWVDPAPAVAEMARVLRPDGVLALVWNLRETSTDFAAELATVLGGGDDTGFSHTDPSTVAGSPFAPGEFFEATWTHRLTAGLLVDLVASRSYVIDLDEDARTRLLDRVDRLARTHPATRESGIVEIPYRTRCWRHRLRTEG